MAVDTLKPDHAVIPVPQDNDPLSIALGSIGTLQQSAAVELTVDADEVIPAPPAWATVLVISPPKAHAKTLKLGDGATPASVISPTSPTIISLVPGTNPALRLGVDTGTLVVDIVYGG